MLAHKSKLKTLSYTLFFGMAVGVAAIKFFKNNEDKIKSDMHNFKDNAKDKFDDTYSVSKDKFEEWTSKIEKILSKAKKENREPLHNIKDNLYEIKENSNYYAGEALDETYDKTGELKNDLKKVI